MRLQPPPVRSGGARVTATDAVEPLGDRFVALFGRLVDLAEMSDADRDELEELISEAMVEVAGRRAVAQAEEFLAGDPDGP